MSTAWNKFVNGNDDIVKGGVTSVPIDNDGYPGDSGFTYTKGTPPLSFSDYVKAYGTDSNKNFEEAMDAASQSYGQSVKAANDDYYRSLMTYGQNAEALSAGGLTGAGVSNYGDHAAYAARQGAVATAGATKQMASVEAIAAKKAEDQANARTYAEYVSEYENSRKSTLLDIYNSGETDASQISLLLTNSRYFSDEEIPALAEQYAAANLGRQKGTFADGIHQQIVGEGIYDEATIRALYSTIPGLSSEELEKYVAKSVAAMSGVATQAQANKDAAKATARYSAYMSLQGKENITLDAVKLALGATGAFDASEIDAEAETLLGQLKGESTVNNDKFLDATAFYTELLNTSGEATAKMLTEKQYGAEVTNNVIESLAKTQSEDKEITRQNELTAFSNTLAALDKKGFAVAYTQDEEGNTVSVDLMEQLEWYNRNGYFEGKEGEYEALKGRIQSHNAEYLSSLYGMARNEWKMDKVLDQFGIELGEDADDEDRMKAAVEAVVDEVFALLEEEYISYEDARTCLTEHWDYEIDAILTDEGNAKDKKETMLRDLCDRFSEFEQYAERIGDSMLLNNCISSLAESIKVEKGKSMGSPCFYVTFGKKTMVIYEAAFSGAKNVVENGRRNLVTFNVIEKSQNGGQKIFDKATIYTADQIISAKKIIDIVLNNTSE